MSIPLLGTDFLTSPTMDGIVSSKTADLLASQGAAMAKDIETRSYVDEAKMMAPKVTQFYSSAYQKIAAGDFTGFGEMQQARMLAIGNPILMKTIDEADQLAGKLAGEFMATKRTELNIDKSMEMEKYRTDKTELLEAGRNARFEAANDRQVKQGNLSTARQLYMQENSAWEKENYAGQKAYEDSMRQYEKRMNAYNEQRKMGDNSAAPPEKPQIWTPRPKPVLDDFISGMSGGVVGDGGGDSESIINIPSTTVPDSVSPDARGASDGKSQKMQGGRRGALTPEELPLPSLNLDDAPLPDATPAAPGTSSALTEISAPPAPPTADGPKIGDTSSQLGVPPPIEQQVQQKVEAGEPPEGLTFGFDPKVGTSLSISITPQGMTKKSVTVDSESGGIKSNYEMSGEDKKAVELVSHFESKENLANWIGRQITLGHKVEAQFANPGDSKDKSVIFRTGKEVFSEKVAGPDGTSSNKPILYAEDDLKKWNELFALARKGVVKISPNKLPKEAMLQLRDSVIRDLASNPQAGLNEANSQLKRLGVTQITEDEVDKLRQDAEDKASQPTKDSNKKQWDSRVEKTLTELGFKLPQKEPKAGFSLKQTMEVAQNTVDTIKRRLERLKSGGPEKLGEARELAAELIKAEDSLKKAINAHAADPSNSMAM